MPDSRWNILVIEEGDVDAYVLMRTLGVIPHRLFKAFRSKTVEEALVFLGERQGEAEKMDLIFLDAGSLNSVVLERALEKIHVAAPQVPVIILTGFGDHRFSPCAMFPGRISGGVMAETLLR